jgi:hypothetical protein
MQTLNLHEKVKALLCAICIAVAFTALLGAASHVALPKNNQSEFGMLDESTNGYLGERANSIDVLIIGDSEVYSSFSPVQMFKEQGFTSYDCASASQLLPYSYALLQRATDNQRPKIVVIETNSVYTTFTLDKALMSMLQGLCPLFEYHNRWKSLSANDLTDTPIATWTDDMKGFKINDAVDAADASHYMEATQSAQEIPRLNQIYLKKMVDYCESIGATPILVSTPSTVNWNMLRHNGITAWAEKEGIAYYDFNVGSNKVEIDWNTDTRDKGDHLNLSGATKFSTAFAEFISTTYDLPDHRNDSDYDNWNAAYDRSLAKMQG